MPSDSMMAVPPLDLTATPMDEDHCRRLIARYLAAYNAFDIDGMLAVLTDDVHFENRSADQITHATDGQDAFRVLAEQGRQVFSEREQRLAGLHVEQGVAIALIAWRGVFAQDIPDGPRAGSTLELQGHSEFGFRDGRICRIVDRS